MNAGERRGGFFGSDPVSVSTKATTTCSKAASGGERDACLLMDRRLIASAPAYRLQVPLRAPLRASMNVN